MPRGSVCPACGQSFKCSVRDHYASHPQCAEAVRRVPKPRSIPASFSVGALEEAVSRDLLDLRFEHGLLDSDIDYIKSCVHRWVELAADVSAYNVAAALSRALCSHRRELLESCMRGRRMMLLAKKLLAESEVALRRHRGGAQPLTPAYRPLGPVYTRAGDEGDVVRADTRSRHPSRSFIPFGAAE